MTEVSVLRISTLVAAAAGTLCLGLQGQLRMGVVLSALFLEVAAAAAPHLLPGERTAKVRRWTANALLLAVCLLEAWLVLAGSGADKNEAAGLLLRVGMFVPLPLVAVIVAQLASADSLRELRIVLVASLLCAFLAVGTARAGTVPDLWSGLGVCLALVWTAALVSLWLLQGAQQQQAASYVHIGHVFGSGRHLGVLILGSVAVGLAAYVLLPHPSGLHLSASGTGASSPQPSDRDGQGAARSTGRYVWGERLDLNSRGDLPATRLVSVPANSPRLWAASILNTYGGRYWRPLVRAWPSDVLPVDSAGDFDLRPGARPGDEPGWAARADTVRLLTADESLPVIAPGQAVSVHLDGQIVRAGQTVTTAGSAHRPSSYVVRSNPEITSLPTVDDTQLPRTLPVRVGDLARRITRDAGATEAKTTAIESYLRAHERYRLDSPVAPRGEDAVDDFLFVSHEGFCEHFASAEAVLLRSVGVPARIVTGFANGEDTGTQRVFRGADAHAWVQVYVGDNRWVFSDPTAGVTLAADRQSWSRWASSEVDAHWRLALSSAAALVVMVALFVLGSRRNRARRERRRMLAAPAQEQVLFAFARFEAALAFIGLTRAPEKSIHELTWSLVARWPLGLPNPEAARAALLVVERVLYDATPVPDAEALIAVATLDQLTALACSPQLSLAST